MILLYVLLGVVTTICFILTLIGVISWALFFVGIVLVYTPLIMFIILKAMLLKKEKNNNNKFSLSRVFQRINTELFSMPKPMRLDWNVREIRHSFRNFDVGKGTHSHISLYAPLHATKNFIRIIYDIDDDKIVDIVGRMTQKMFVEDPFYMYEPSHRHKQENGFPLSRYDHRYNHRLFDPPYYPQQQNQQPQQSYEFDTELDKKEDKQK